MINSGVFCGYCRGDGGRSVDKRGFLEPGESYDVSVVEAVCDWFGDGDVDAAFVLFLFFCGEAPEGTRGACVVVVPGGDMPVIGGVIG